MKYLCMVACMLLVSCKGITREDLSADDQVTYDALVEQGAMAQQVLANARAELAAAQATGDVAAITDAEAKVAAAEQAVRDAEAQFADFERLVLKDRYGPLLAGLAAIPGVGPIAAQFSPLLFTLLPLTTKRGRKHYRNAVREWNPWEKGPSAGKGTVSPIAGLEDLLRAWGLKHSSPDTEAVADGVATAVPAATTITVAGTSSAPVGGAPTAPAP